MEKLMNLAKKFLTREMIFYVIFGILTTLISIIAYNICFSAGFDIVASNTIATVIAVLFAFITNKIWVFESKDWSLLPILAELSKFAVGRIFTYVLETYLLVVIAERMNIPPMIAKIATSVVVILLNYIISKFGVFKK